MFCRRRPQGAFDSAADASSGRYSHGQRGHRRNREGLAQRCYGQKGCIEECVLRTERQAMDLPARWRDYPCADYFSSPFAETGLWDRGAEFWVIEPAQKVEEEAEIEFLQVGRPGVDSIGFGYRKGQPGFWAYDPMEQE